MERVVCEDCGSLFLYDEGVVKICMHCVKERIERKLRGGGRG